MPIRTIRNLLWGALALSGLAQAADITLLATLEGKAVFVVNGARRTIQVGEQTPDFKLLSITADSAIIESGGEQRRLGLGEGYVAVRANTDGGGRLILSPDAQGQYFTEVSINGHKQRGVIDTGATHLSMSRSVAAAMNVDYTRGRQGQTQTANGAMHVWLVRIPQLQLGTITVYDVDTVVGDVNDNGPIMIGTSLLNRFQMARDQGLMILSKKSY